MDPAGQKMSGCLDCFHIGKNTAENAAERLEVAQLVLL